MARSVKDKRLSFTGQIGPAVSGADAVFIAVGTPPSPEHGRANLAYVYAAAREIAAAVTDYTLIVTKSTVPVGTGDIIEGIMSAAGADVAVVSNPEFLREGAAIDDFQRPDRVVVGTEDPKARDVMARLYQPLTTVGVPIVMTQRRTAELIKYAANAFLATKITFINEIADLCEVVGAQIQDVALAVGLDHRIGGEFLQAGPGYGGSCFPKDTIALIRTAQEHSVPLRLVQETVAVNGARRQHMATKVIEAVGGAVEGLTIAVLGLTFKPNTDDMREAPSVDLIEALQHAGARIHAHDPQGMEQARTLLTDVAFFADPYSCAEGADAVVLMTEWDDLKGLDLVRLRDAVRTPVLVDLRNMYDRDVAENCGFSFVGIGLPSRAAASLRKYEVESTALLHTARLRMLPTGLVAKQLVQATRPSDGPLNEADKGLVQVNRARPHNGSRHARKAGQDASQ
jgi:UDPglucose 6-dehydrogenase